MSCFSCFSSNGRRPSRRFGSRKEHAALAEAPLFVSNRSTDLNRRPEPAQKTSNESVPDNEVENKNIAAQTFTFRELATATRNFRSECLLGEGGFGRVYKGNLENGQLVAVKQLDRNGFQGNREFLVEVLMLSLLHHQNLVNLIGYCADGDQRLLVYEFMALGSLEDHLLESNITSITREIEKSVQLYRAYDIPDDRKPLSWAVRMKAAFGAAKGLEYLHEKANPPVIYRDLKSSNILLDEEYNPKLSDFGLAKLGPMGDKVHVSSRVMGTYGYCAPEYARTGQLTLKSDVYSFGVVLLELITGRRAIDTRRPTHEQQLVNWAQPMFKDQKRYTELADPRLEGDYPVRGLNQAVAVAAMCLQEDAPIRPMMTDVVTALNFLVTPCTEESSVQEPAPDNSILLGGNIVQDRERAVQEAIEWGASSRHNQIFRHEDNESS